MAKLYGLSESILPFQDGADWNIALDLNERVKRFQNGFTNPDVDTGTIPETIWSAGGLYTFPAAAAATTIVSGSANDAAAGTGARTVLVEGLLAGYVFNSETVTLNGMTPVALASNYLRINKMTVMTAGTGQTNAGAIDCQIGGTTANYISVGKSISQNGFYTVPANYQKALLTYLFLNTAASGTGNSDMELILYYNGVKITKQEYGIDLAGSSFVERDMHTRPMVLEPTTDIIVNVTTTSVNNIKTNGVWTFTLFE
jgi:hypothetical protein